MEVVIEITSLVITALSVPAAFWISEVSRRRAERSEASRLRTELSEASRLRERRFANFIELRSAILEVFHGGTRAIHVGFADGMLLVTTSDPLDEFQQSLLADLADRFAGHDGLVTEVDPDLLPAAV